ncbi:MAG: glycosyltransferase [Actinomycetota bacterium]|nr:glycosyltransferase [Actinomycetota bacterium]
MPRRAVVRARRLPINCSVLMVTTVPITLEAFLLPFARHFRGLGWRVDALANDASSNPWLDGEFGARFDVGWSRDAAAPSNLIGTPRNVRRIIMAGGYDIVHVHTPVAAFVTRFALRSIPADKRPAIIYTAHGFHFYEGQDAASHALFRSMERLAAPWTDFLVTVNQEDFEAAASLGGLPASRVRHIPGIGVDTHRFSPDATPADDARSVRQELNISAEEFMLTMIAELAPVKRHDHLLRALARVQDPRVVLVLVGTGHLEPKLRELAVALGVANRVRWAGYRRDIPAVLAASDAAALVSEREGLPRSVLEAMATGVPVIGTDTRGITDAIGDEAGWVVAKNDTVALGAAIEQAAADPVQLASRGRAARERALERFALTRIISEYEDLYREALASHV